MDPSDTQQDKSNDAHSLESGGGQSAPQKQAAANEDGSPQKTTDGAIDATGGVAPESSNSKNKPKVSLLGKFWHKFNIYLMLFILVVFMSVGVLAYLTLKGRQTTTTTLSSQSLSESTLKQLADTDVTVGKNNQILTVQSNAIFAGAVLARSSLDVAGSLKVGGNLNLSDLTVSGATELGDAQTNNLTVQGSLNLQGSLTLKNGINVTGNSNFTGVVTISQLNAGSLQINGDLNLTHHVVAGGNIPSATRGVAVGGGGTVNLTGSDTSGSITVNTGSAPPPGCFITVTFSKKFAGTPHVVVTPVGSDAASLQYYIDRTTASFTVCTANSAPVGTSFGFDYIVLG
ncbi:MAG TPA: hypothetical protein VLH84_01865 [Patescibacteria group bacterium]|nr:hypothetical protein [Patescibacteria group bacterium]